MQSQDNRLDTVNQFFDVAAKKIEISKGEEKRYCTFEGFMRCIYDFIDFKNELMTVEYTLVVCDDKYMPYGIKAVMRDSDNKIVEHGVALKKFATLSECFSKMYMMACETVLPYTIEYIL